MNHGLRFCESYEDFLKRIFSFEKAEFTFGTEKFESSGSVMAKVNEDGSFRRFIGDTVVFDLEPEQKRTINEQYIKPLYRVAPECFAEKFHESTLHVTLHDLSATGSNDYEVLQKMFETEVQLAKKLKKMPIKVQKIEMVTTCVFNMVNTSLVLGLVPKTHEDFEKLMEMYCFVDGIHQLPYPLTPHITLAYYGRNVLDGEKMRGIEQVVNTLNRESLNITLSTVRLYYQKFIDMNTFFNIMSFCDVRAF